MDACPALRPRWVPDARPVRRRDCCLPQLAQRRPSHQGGSRGSITRPTPSLSTLRSGPHDPPRKTRFRLVANLDRTGFPPAGLLQKVSELCSFAYIISSSFPRLHLAHAISTPTFQWREDGHPRKRRDSAAHPLDAPVHRRGHRRQHRRRRQRHVAGAEDREHRAALRKRLVAAGDDVAPTVRGQRHRLHLPGSGKRRHPRRRRVVESADALEKHRGEDGGERRRRTRGRGVADRLRRVCAGGSVAGNGAKCQGQRGVLGSFFRGSKPPGV